MRKRRILKEAKYFYREDAKTAKRQKGRSKKHFSHGMTRKNTESKHIFQSRMLKRRLLTCASAYELALHIFTSLKRKQRFFKYMFTIHTLFLRLRFRLVRQEIPLRVGFHIRSSFWTKERGPFDKLRDRGSFDTVSELAELAVNVRDL